MKPEYDQSDYEDEDSAGEEREADILSTSIAVN